MPLPLLFDFKNREYGPFIDLRVVTLNKIRQNPSLLTELKLFYRENPAQFIIDWGCTADPRNVSKGLPGVFPFLLYPKQEEWVNWVFNCWKKKQYGLTEKSRGMGMSWLSIALLCTMCLFYEDFTGVICSRKREYVDSLASPKALLPKARQFMQYLPQEFTGSWDARKHAPFMKILFPDTGSILEAEAGDGLGRGGRGSLVILDEAAWILRPDSVDAALSQTAESRIDVSTPNGTANTFYQKVSSGKFPTFTFHWRDDPTKDEEWYQRECEKIGDPVIIAQELDISYNASKEGVLIPYEWVECALDAHLVLKVLVEGVRIVGFDVADEGKDKNGFCARHDILVEYVTDWSGTGGDIYESVRSVFNLCDRYGYRHVYYDADGLGAGVRGDAKQINATRDEKIVFDTFRGSGGVLDPDREMVPGRKNVDFFYNRKAQAWWSLRMRFQETYRAVVEKMDYNPLNIISISSQSGMFKKLILELSQPTYSINTTGKIIIDKVPDGARSPNLADAVLMAFAPPVRKIWRPNF